MDDISRSISEAVKSGEYFKDAYSWYQFKYIYPLTQRAVLQVFVLMIVICMSIIAYNVFQLLPISREVKFVIKVDEQSLNSSKIIQIPQNINQPMLVVADYLVRQYVLKREAYYYKNIENQIKFIQNNSSKHVYRLYYDLMNIGNPDSPILLYQKDIIRDVKINSVNFDYNSDKNGLEGINNAIIYFEASLYDNNVITKSIWVVNMNFELSDIESVLEGDVPFKFVVTDYLIKQTK